MQRVLVTGAAGGIGSRLRKLLKGIYPEIRWSDVKVPPDLAPDAATDPQTRLPRRLRR